MARISAKRFSKRDLAKKLKTYNTCKNEFLHKNGNTDGFDPSQAKLKASVLRIINNQVKGR